jgi:hypothetical protein
MRTWPDMTSQILTGHAWSAVNQGVGFKVRPSLTGSPVHSPEVKARVPHTLERELQKEAERRGQTSSALLREALEQYLKGA